MGDKKKALILTADADVRLICGAELTFDKYLPYVVSTRRALQSRRGGIATGGFSQPRLLMSDLLTLAHEVQLERSLNSVLQSKPPAVVWNRASRFSWAARAAAERLGAVFVYEALDNLDRNGCRLLHPLHSHQERSAMTKADYVVVVSDYWAVQLAKTFRLNRNKFLVMHNSVEPADFVRDLKERERIRNNLGIGPLDAVIGYVGTYPWYHDIGTLARTVAQTARIADSRTRLHWLMVGQGEGRSVLEEVARKVPDVHLLPWVSPSEVPAYYAAMDMGVLPGSLPEICPIKVFEYMAAGLVPVVPRTPANEEVVKHLSNGLLFSRGDSASLVDCLQKAVSEPGLRQSLAQRARDCAVNEFNPSLTMGRVIKAAFALATERRSSEQGRKGAASRQRA